MTTTPLASLESTGAPQRGVDQPASPATGAVPAAEIDQRTGVCLPPGWRQSAPMGSWRPGSFDDGF